MPKKRKFFAGNPPEKVKVMTSTGDVNETDLHFIKLIKDRKYAEAIDIIDQVKNINIRDQITQNTALHFAALRSVIGLVEELEKRADLDYLVRNGTGKYSSQLAWEVSGHEELGAQLMVKERDQGLRDNVQVWPKPELPEP